MAAHLGDLRPTVGHVSGPRYRRDRVYTTLPAEAIASYQVVTEYEPASLTVRSWRPSILML